MIKNFKDWLKTKKYARKLKKARKAAKKYHLDFNHKCLFNHQLSYSGLNYGNGEIAEVPMESGKTGLYQVISDSSTYNGTGQRDWYFTFMGYKEDNHAYLERNKT